MHNATHAVISICVDVSLCISVDNLQVLQKYVHQDYSDSVLAIPYISLLEI